LSTAITLLWQGDPAEVHEHHAAGLAEATVGQGVAHFVNEDRDEDRRHPDHEVGQQLSLVAIRERLAGGPAEEQGRRPKPDRDTHRRLTE